MIAAFLILLLGAAPSGAVELPDGAWVLGAGAGLGSPLGAAKNAGGSASAMGGQVLYHPYGDFGVGVQVDRELFKAKNGNRPEASLVTLVGRKNFNNDYEELLPYVLGGIGYSEARADLAAGGATRGSGPAITFGLGLDYFLASRLNAGVEVRFLRAAAPLPRLGLGGLSAVAVLIRLNGILGPESNPFPR